MMLDGFQRGVGLVVLTAYRLFTLLVAYWMYIMCSKESLGFSVAGLGLLWFGGKAPAFKGSFPIQVAIHCLGWLILLFPAFFAIYGRMQVSY